MVIERVSPNFSQTDSVCTTYDYVDLAIKKTFHPLSHAFPHRRLDPPVSSPSVPLFLSESPLSTFATDLFFHLIPRVLSEI